MMTKEQFRIAAQIRAGRVFDTPFETGCVAINGPDSDGEFAGLDSDGVECAFTVSMVTRLGEIDKKKLEQA